MNIDPAVIERIHAALGLARNMQMMKTTRERDEAWRVIRDAHDEIGKILDAANG